MMSSVPEEEERLLNSITSDYVSQENSSEPPSGYVVYKRRWYILAVVALLGLSNNMLWLSFAPIADYAASYYHLNGTDSGFKVNLFSLVYPIATVPVGILATWLLDSMGLRLGIVMASWVNLVGSVLRMMSGFDMITAQNKYPLALAGQTIAACAQPFFMFAPTKLAGLWFHQNQRATANMIASMANPMGILLANVISPVIVKEKGDVYKMLIVYTVLPGIGALMATAGVTSSKPPTPPTSSAAEDTVPFKEGLKAMFKVKSYWVLAVCFGAGLGLFTTLSTLLEQILCGRKYTDVFAGICGALLIGIGIIGAAVASVFVDKTKKFEEVAKVSFAMAGLASVMFALVSMYEGHEAWIAISMSLFGFFGFAVYPICLELGVECTYPVAEATSTGFLIISGQLQVIVYVLVMPLLAKPMGGYCSSSHSSAESIKSMNYTVPNLCFAGVTVVVACLFMTLFKSPYKRLQMEQRLAAERILSYGTRNTWYTGT